MQPWDAQGQGGVPVQPVIVQPMPAQSMMQPMPVQTMPADADVSPGARHPNEMIIYSHSTLVYWWPVWLVGFIMTALTWMEGQVFEVSGHRMWVHPNGSLGVVFFMTVFLVVLITNISVRGIASAMVILVAVLVVVLLAFFGLWDTILGWLGDLRIHMNLGAYFWFSTMMFIVWLATVFVFDRMSFWRVRPGQVTYEYVIGAATRTYDTKNLVLEKYRDDVFRHWILGLGSGDLHMKPFGARSEDIEIPNVLFIGSKIEKMMRLINTEPAQVT